MNEETVLVVLMGLLLLLLFVVAVASDAVAIATLPGMSRDGTVSGATGLDPGLRSGLTARA